MRYADPNACPSCRGPIGGVSRCGNCGFDLTSPQAAELWRLFLQADTLITQTDPRATQAEVSPSTRHSEFAPVQVPVADGAAAPTASSRTLPKMSAGTVLLGLGALSLVVAAVIFVSLNWGQLGLLARTLVLVAITAAFATALALTLRHKMRASSEALSFVVLGMLTVDFYGAVDSGLVSLNKQPDGLNFGLWALLLVGVGYFIVRAARSTFSSTMWTADVIAVLSVVISVPMIAYWLMPSEDYSSAWTWFLIIALIVHIVHLMFATYTKQRVSMWGSTIAGFLWLCAAVLLASYDHLGDSRGFNLDTILPLLVLIALSIAIAFVLRPALESAARFAVACSIVLLTGMISPLIDRHLEGGIPLLITGSVLTASCLLLASPKTWYSRAFAGVSLFGALLFGVYWLTMLEPNFDRLNNPGENLLTVVPRDPEAVGNTITILILGASVAILIWQNTRWSVRIFSKFGVVWTNTVTALVIWGTLTTVFVFLGAPALLHAFAVALTMPILSFLLRKEPAGFQLLISPFGLWAVLLVMPFPMPAAVLVAFVSAMFALATWIAVERISVGTRSGLSQACLSGLTVISGLSAVAVIVRNLSLSDRPSIAILAVVLSLAIVSSAGLSKFTFARWGVETALAFWAVALCVLASGSYDAETSLAIVFLLLAMGTSIVAVIDPERRWAVLSAALFLSLAWIFFLAGRDVETVEIYTVPIALLALALGLVALRLWAQLNTWFALAIPLVVGFLPSLPAIAEEPASLRAAIWGIAGLLSLGSGIRFRLQAPVVVGALVIACVVLLNLGPVVLALHRWILFGGIGLILLGIGITWEKRVTDGRALASFLARMR